MHWSFSFWGVTAKGLVPMLTLYEGLVIWREDPGTRRH